MQGFKDWHLVIFIIIVTGIAVFLLVLEVAIPQLRGSVTRVRDQEQPEGRTVCTIAYLRAVCVGQQNAML